MADPLDWLEVFPDDIMANISSPDGPPAFEV